MKVKDFLAARWEEYKNNPLIEPPFPSPIIADPTFLPPSNTPDGRWHLFAHSLLGIHHFLSDDGLRWHRLPGAVCRGSLRPFIHAEGGSYYLFYEKVLALRPCRSHIECRQSPDLARWGKPMVVLEPSLNWHREETRHGAMGNPCLVKEEDGYSLYYSAGLVFLKDCKFSEPKYIGLARSATLIGPYHPLPQPLITPTPGGALDNLGAGAIKVLKLEDGYVGFQNGIYWNSQINHSGSAIRTLTSPDGRSWIPSSEKPLLKPEEGWKKSHVYALDVKPVGDSLYLYFNARSGWVLGKERVGLALGKLAG